MSYVLLLLTGFVSAVFGSIVGLGGGIIIVPMLIYFGEYMLGESISTSVAVGTSLTVLIVTALASSVSYHKQKRIDMKSAWLFFAASGPATIVGASLTDLFNPDTFELAFGIFMLLMAILLIARAYMKPLNIQWGIRRTFTDQKGTTYEYGYGRVSALIVGFFVGFVSGLFGIGGGSLFVPAMVLLFGYPPHVATATSMFVIFLSSLMGSTAHWVQGNIHLIAALLLAPGAWLGGKTGAWITMKMSSEVLLWVLRVTFVVVAFRMIFSGITG
ncbi:sulfite exporter TauE/SafE family protein [Marinicrinis lubricantis]|uniref:Probable membrane transporter protein n=1 Tax=Marinicrinis lubricantis TaxID=2086470 RepID=A0ABW1ISJ6_9BACL